MKKELEEKLYDKYPLIYSGHMRPMTDTQMCWGFQCDDGWYSLIDTFSALAEAYSQHHELDTEITCVKEKFGGLRIHIMGGGETLQELAALTERLSYMTCEHCGIKTGEYDERLVKKNDKNVEEDVDNEEYIKRFAKVTTGPLVGERGWIYTMCGKCRREEVERRGV